MTYVKCPKKNVLRAAKMPRLKGKTMIDKLALQLALAQSIVDISKQIINHAGVDLDEPSCHTQFADGHQGTAISLRQLYTRWDVTVKELMTCVPPTV
jgi:hypothetical protein